MIHSEWPSSFFLPQQKLWNICYDSNFVPDVIKRLAIGQVNGFSSSRVVAFHYLNRNQLRPQCRSILKLVDVPLFALGFEFEDLSLDRLSVWPWNRRKHVSHIYDTPQR